MTHRMVLKSLCVALCLCSSATAAAATGAQIVVELAGTYDAVHPHWRDTLTLKADGSYARGNGDPGTWTFDGKTLTLAWKKWGPEPVVFRGPGAFAAESGGFSLSRRDRIDTQAVVGVYDAVHPHWRDTVAVNADGTYARSGGDGGVWIFDGKSLVLFWTNWGPESLKLSAPGRFASASNFQLTKRAEGAPSAVATPAPAAPAAPLPRRRRQKAVRKGPGSSRSIPPPAARPWTSTSGRRPTRAAPATQTSSVGCWVCSRRAPNSRSIASRGTPTAR